MDHVPLPFVVSQDATCATENDQNAHMSAPIEALRKRQFAMRVFCNAGMGEDRGGCAALVRKGSPKGWRTQSEKLAYDHSAPMLFQKNAWTDAPAMMELAKNFA